MICPMKCLDTCPKFPVHKIRYMNNIPKHFTKKKREKKNMLSKRKAIPS